MSVRLSIPILLVVVFQLLTFFSILIFGGEFRDIRQYAYSTLIEKTENRSTYIRNELQEKPILVQDCAGQINEMVAQILEERGATIADLQSDSDLNRTIIESSVDAVSGLLRRSAINDAYLILETGDLYAGESAGGNAKAALYLRDVDPKSGSGYEDILLEVGYTSIPQNWGITRHSGWSLYFMPDPEDEANFDFYYRTMATARENPDLSLNYLGYWSGFSRLASMTTPSLKYTVPLIAGDGTVYGVLGVGMTENYILSNIPSHDFLSETACYVLGRGSTASNSYDIMTYSGNAYTSLLGSADTLQIGDMLETNIYSFDMQTDVALAGTVQQFSLYNQNSPYAGEQWALISVADRSTVLRPMLFLQRMLLISALVSLLVAAVIAVISCIGFIKPITDAIRRMSDKRTNAEIIHFMPSNIYEIDKMTDAITQLQVNVQNYSSQVSRMLRIADMGLGMFTYDHTDGSVFVGQSFQDFQKEHARSQQDVVMTLEEFLDSIYDEQIAQAIREGVALGGSAEQEDHSHVYRIDPPDGATQWIRLSLIYAENSSIGVLQDITDTMLEKRRIEFERDYDRLTGLLNRHAYYQRIEQLFHDKDRLKITAFIMIDLDNLKYVNDTYGHDFGDDYIKTAATTLATFQNFGGIVSRISGDEFNICLPGFESKDEVRDIIAHVRDQLLQGSCLLADGTHFKIRASIGVSWYPDDAVSYELLMKYADFAMYTIKHSTKGEVAEFDMSSYATDAVLLTGVEEMNHIIEEGRVRYAFQSIISAKTGEVYGYEALMRVQSDIFQNPLELLRTAKTGAKLYEIERLTWQKSLAEFQALIDAGRVDPTAHIFLNSIANTQLEPADEDEILGKYPHLLTQLVLEILEGESSNEECIAHKTELIRKCGAQLALDDFGTGYNSEYALLTIHPNIIKIDRSITNGCDKDVSRRMIINNLVRLARTKQILVLVEGVETEAEMRTVISCGVDLLQGYYFGHPLFDPQPLSPDIAATIRRLSNPSGIKSNS